MRFFSSDHHFWHINVIKYCSRPYSSVEDMNEDLVKRHNEIIKPDDEVYFLGDFSLAFGPVEHYPQRLNGKKYLVPGNHDFCHSYHRKSRSPENKQKWIQKYVDNGFILLPEETSLELKDKSLVNLSHLPYPSPLGDETAYDDKYETYRPMDEGKVLLCGHVHEKWKTKKSNKGTLMINVGVDAWAYAPVSEDDIIKTIKDES